LCKLGHLLANQIVISFNINYFLFNLVKEGTALKPFLLIISEENWEVVVALWEDVDINVPL
jgi:hypothetical protein